MFLTRRTALSVVFFLTFRTTSSGLKVKIVSYVYVLLQKVCVLLIRRVSTQFLKNFVPAVRKFKESYHGIYS